MQLTESEPTCTRARRCARLLQGLLLARLTDAHRLPALVYLAVCSSVDIIVGCDCSPPRTSSLFAVSAPVLAALTHYLLHCLLSYPLVSEVVELLQLVHELALFHALVDFRDQILKGLLDVQCVQGAGLHKFDL